MFFTPIQSVVIICMLSAMCTLSIQSIYRSFRRYRARMALMCKNCRKKPIVVYDVCLDCYGESTQDNPQQLTN